MLLLALAPRCGAAEDEAARRVVRDDTGTDVAVPAHPARIACLAPDLTELAFMLGAGPSVKGACDDCAFSPEAAALPRLGPMTAPSVEAIAVLQPDLVLATADGNPLAVVERLRALGIPVVGLKPAPGLAGIAQQIRRVGALLSRQAEAEALASRLEASVAALRLRTADAPRTRACILVWTDPLVAAGTDSYLTELADAAGADNACATGEGWPTLSRESVLLAQPAVVLLATGVASSALGDWAASLPAVRRGAVVPLPERPFLRPSAGLASAPEDLEALLRPWREPAP